MISRYICAALSTMLLTGGLVYAIDQKAAQPEAPVQNLSGGLPLKQPPQIQLTPQYLMSEISALKAQVQVLQNQVVSLQSNLAATTNQQGNRLSRLESVLAVDPSGNITISSPGRIKLQASIIEGSASSLNVNAGVAGFHGVLKADTVISKQMVSASYAPGAGNIW